ncbi:MAG: hypothetical protein ABI729_08080 [Chitinophagales bacterium]
MHNYGFTFNNAGAGDEEEIGGFGKFQFVNERDHAVKVGDKQKDYDKYKDLS